MRPRRPYLIRALYEWLVDAGDLPHLLVDAGVAGADIPADYVRDGRIVFNVGPGAVQSLELGNDEIRFSARFRGTPSLVRFPPAAVIAIYGRDTGEGMMFGAEEITDEASTDDHGDGAKPARPDKSPKSGKPWLKVIK